MMPTQVLQCPFCDTTSSRGTGLSAHIRGRHPKEYAKWIKDPNRIQAAQKAVSPKKAANKPDKAVPGPVVCPDCGKTFKTLAALGGHRAYLHKTLKKTTGTAKPQIPAPAKSDASKSAGSEVITEDHRGVVSPIPRAIDNTDNAEGMGFLAMTRAATLRS